MNTNKNDAYSINELVQGCIKGNRDMQSRLFYTSYPVLLAVISRYVKSDEEKKEILQEAFIKIFSRINDLKDPSSYAGWSRRIVVNLCMDHWRKIQPPVEFKDKLHNLTDDDGDHMDEDEQEDILGRITLDDVQAALEEIPTGYRTVFMMYAIDGLSHKEIAAALNTTESTSKSQYLRAKKAIKNLIIKKLSHAGKVRP